MIGRCCPTALRLMINIDEERSAGPLDAVRFVVSELQARLRPVEAAASPARPVRPRAELRDDHRAQLDALFRECLDDGPEGDVVPGPYAQVLDPVDDACPMRAVRRPGPQIALTLGQSAARADEHRSGRSGARAPPTTPSPKAAAASRARSHDLEASTMTMTFDAGQASIVGARSAAVARLGVLVGLAPAESGGVQGDLAERRVGRRAGRVQIRPPSPSSIEGEAAPFSTWAASFARRPVRRVARWRERPRGPPRGRSESRGAAATARSYKEPALS